MSDPVEVEISGGLCVLRIANPPLNVTSASVRSGLSAALDLAFSGVLRGEVSRVVLTGAGRVFVAGADAREFDAAPVPPHLPDLCARIEGFAVPVVAAINGAALGGGLELALASAARVAVPGAVLGLPETTLGLVPGAGGTQRLPRLVGLAAALALIPEGRSLTAAEALAAGLVDAVTDAGDVVAAAAALALPDRPATGALPAPAPDPAAFAAARKAVARKLPRQTAPLQAIGLIEAACTLPLAEGLAQERAAFLALRAGEQAAALRHLFFAERAAMARGRKDPAAAEITAAVVVGGGTMGAGITHALAAAGIAVTLVEADAAAARRAQDNVARLRDEALARGRITAEAAGAMAGRCDFRTGYADLPPAGIAIEAVFEDLAVKRAVFAALDAALPETAILATNTSYLDPGRIAEGRRHPGRILGLHFFSPAHVMKLVEVIRGRDTSAATLATALRLAGRLGKIPVEAGVCDGFIGNRILTRYRQACDVMLIEGALPAQVDAAMRGFGMAMGPYEVQDLSGLDIAYANRKRLGWKTKPGFRYIPIADRIVEETGRLGRKTGAGWYDYPETAPAAASSKVPDATHAATPGTAPVPMRAPAPANLPGPLPAGTAPAALAAGQGSFAAPAPAPAAAPPGAAAPAGLAPAGAAVAGAAVAGSAGSEFADSGFASAGSAAAPPAQGTPVPAPPVPAISVPASPVPTPSVPTPPADPARGPVPSAVIEALVAEESARAGLTRRPFTAEEIVGRATAAMIEESAAILAEGIAATPEDIDLVLVHGYGFPRWRGGPLHWAKTQGLDTFLNRIAKLHKTDPMSWNPNNIETIMKKLQGQP